jgi:hypothetical protein
MSNPKDFKKRVLECTDPTEAEKLLLQIYEDAMYANLDPELEHLKTTKSNLDYLMNEVRILEEEHAALEIPRDLSQLQEIRNKLSFTYREMYDKVTWVATYYKNTLDNSKSTAKVQALSELEKSGYFAENKVPKSSQMEHVGASQAYTQWVEKTSYASANYTACRDAQNAIQKFIDALSSEIRINEQVTKRDAK